MEEIKTMQKLQINPFKSGLCEEEMQKEINEHCL